ncbi:hypothetical protein AB1Y20_010942 [Prymnesium parvum]|uniref:TLC domain-containing protein n=1 Tax=Prymnesium parvum TaxID=97485 RepID=A0AB34IR47_PRYPA
MAPPWALALLSGGFFWLSYLYALPALCKRLLPDAYGAFNPFNRRCFVQNLCSMAHTTLAFPLLAAALLTEPQLLAARLSPARSRLLDVDVSLSLGYFSLSLPLSLYMRFALGARAPYASALLCLHHALVVVAQLAFLATRRPPFYMACSGVLFEASNLVYIPHILRTQLRADATRLSAALLFLTYTLTRVLGVTALVPLSLADLRAAEPAEAPLVPLLCLYGLLLISWVWYVRDLLPAAHAGLQEWWGETYYHACYPRAVRMLVWTRCTADGRSHAVQRRALRELRMEAALAEVAEQHAPMEA